MSKILVSVLLLTLPLGSCLAQDHVSAWLVDSLVKVFPDSLPRNSHPFEAVPTARNGHASLQVALRSGQQQTITVKLIAPRRKTISLEARLFRVGYVHVSSHPKDVPLDEVVRPEVGPYPDPLYPLTGSFNLDASKTDAIWISVFTPSDAPPGVYEGRIEIRSGQETHNQKLNLPFRIEVFAATVPKEQHLSVTNWLWFDRELIAKHYPSTKLDPQRYWNVLENTGKTMAAYKQNVTFVPVRSLAPARLVDGNVQYDFGEFDHWIDIFDQAGSATLIEGGHLCQRAGGGFDAPVILPTDLIEDGAIVRKELPADDPRAEQNLRQFLRQLCQHLRQKGWLHRYVQHVHDEPHGAEMPIYKRFTAIVREEMPEVRTIDAINLKEDLAAVESTTIWVPLLSSFDDELEVIKQHQAQGGQVWYYICLFPRGRYLNRFIDYPLLKIRLLPWFNFRFGLSGYLHWGGNFWTDDPFNDLQPNWGGDVVLPAGDDAIVYPDPANESVFVSTRLEIMREGIEEYELLRSSQSQKPDAASGLAKSVLPGFTDYLRDVSAFRSYERELFRMSR